jgi:hypothetical protein
MPGVREIDLSRDDGPDQGTAKSELPAYSLDHIDRLTMITP